jgi:formylglycine-generating enzyme required for sulfatase activity
MKWLILTSAVFLSSIVLVAVVTFGLGLDDNKYGLPIGYYGQYNLARRAIESAGCFERIDQSYAREKLVIDPFSFTAITKYDWKIELWFTSAMDVRQVCEHPEGILLHDPVRRQWQAYSLEFLSNELNAGNVSLQNISDLFCNLDQLVAIIRANYRNNQVPLTPQISGAYQRYLALEVIPWKRVTTTPRAIKQVRISGTRGELASGSGTGSLQGISFDTVRLSSKGEAELKQTGYAKCYIESLGNGSTLEMIQLPGGTFNMGSSSSEKELISEDSIKNLGADLGYFEHEYPEHTVTVPSFRIGRFEVTQSQWRAVSLLPKVKRELVGEPSVFSGDDLPVENVTWLDALEFCERLSKATQRTYRLPTEAEWEYACRAGTSTPFHFGETIDSEFVNFDGTHPWKSGSWGISRRETTAVGSFGFANSFGLYDMHGNVREWCIDVWHDNYSGAPMDGSAWIVGGDDRFRLTRGGDWFQIASRARSGSRRPCAPTSHDSQCGFRVVTTL